MLSILRPYGVVESSIRALRLFLAEKSEIARTLNLKSREILDMYNKGTLGSVINWRGQSNAGGGQTKMTPQNQTPQMMNYAYDYGTFFNCFINVLSDQLYRRYQNINDLSAVTDDNFLNIARLSFGAVVHGLDVWEELSPELITQIQSKQDIRKAG